MFYINDISEVTDIETIVRLIRIMESEIEDSLNRKLEKLGWLTMTKQTIAIKGTNKIIKRVLRAEVFGNFNPVFCTYLGKKHLVRSGFGDLSDPFRRTLEYLSDLYIEVAHE